MVEAKDMGVGGVLLGVGSRSSELTCSGLRQAQLFQQGLKKLNVRGPWKRKNWIDNGRVRLGGDWVYGRMLETGLGSFPRRW